MVLKSFRVAAWGLATTLAVAPLALAAQQCPAERREPDLGFSGIDCVQCTLHMRGNKIGWMEFGAEPVLRHIRTGGPAAGKLQEADVVVAVAGLPITAEAGGRLFANPDIGKPLRLTVRRGGRELEVEIVPALRCAAGAEEPGRRPSAPSPAARARERGRLGFALACRCIVQTDPDGGELWEFKDYPEVVAIDSTGPAALAGLLPGDTLQAIDGFGLLTAEGGRRFGAIRPGDTVRLTALRRGLRRVMELTAARPRPR
jgi:S1-C subfamily serine protease